MKIQLINKSPFDNPSYAKEGDSGMDLRANFAGVNNLEKTKGKVMCVPVGEWNDGEGLSKIIIDPDSRVIIPTGMYISLPKFYEAQVRPKSGQSFNKGFTVYLGTVDSNYRGEIGVIVANNTNRIIEIEHGEKVAQLVIAPVSQVEFENVDQLDTTERGEGGFGSTGIK